MDKRDDGKYCGSCQKTVIDFTKMSDEDLIRFVTKHKNQHLCGYVNDDQLDRNMEIPVKKIPWLRYFFQVAIPAFLVSYKVNAQGMTRKELRPAVLVEDRSKDKKNHLPITVNGYVHDELGNPVPGATIKIPGSSGSTGADSSGNFTIPLAANENNIEITALGYEKKLIAVTGTYVDVKLNIPALENIVITGRFGANRTARSQAGGMNIVFDSKVSGAEATGNKNPGTNTRFSIFPNPVKRDGILTIRFDNTTGKERELILYNAAGIELLRQPMRTKQLSIPLHLYAAGYHILRIVDKKTGNVLSQPVIVE